MIPDYQDPRRGAAIRRLILEKLLRSDPMPLSETTLFVEMQLVQPAPSQDEIDAALKWLAERSHIKSEANPLDPEQPLWFVTTIGRAAARK